METVIVLAVGIVLLGLAYWFARPPAYSGQVATAAGAARPMSDASHGSAKEKASAEPRAKPEPAKKPEAAKKPEPVKKPEAAKAAAPLPKVHDEEDDPDIDLTIVTLGPLSDSPPPAQPPPLPAKAPKAPPLPQAGAAPPAPPPPMDEPESAIPILYDDDAALDEPTRATAFILVSAAGQTDRGQRRKNNEDSYLVMEKVGLFVVADGMGGYAGGEVASQLAVDVMEKAFQNNAFDGEPYTTVPRRGSELAQAIQMANAAIFGHAQANRELAEMGTTVVSARFSPNKQRLYVGHVGDSRCYRLRDGELKQITTDHTMAALGMKGPFANRLNRAVGIAPRVKIDLILAKPRPNDVYVLCSDGLSKMVSEEAIQQTLLAERGLERSVASLIEQANDRGGKDNITVILVKVKSPADVARGIV